MRDNGGTQTVATDLNLAPLSNGDYLIEVTAKSGEKSQTEVVAIRVSMARWRWPGSQDPSLKTAATEQPGRFLFAFVAPGSSDPGITSRRALRRLARRHLRLEHVADVPLPLVEERHALLHPFGFGLPRR